MTEQQPGTPVIPEVTRWRKRPVEVSAVQWTGANVDEVLALAGGGYFDTVPPEDRAEDPDMTAEVYDKLHGTWVHVYDGQWIIRGIQGELYPCADDVFAATYEPAGFLRPVAAALEGHAGRADAESPSAASAVPPADSAEAKLAEIAAHVRDRLNAPGRAGMSRAAARIILGIAEGSDKEGTQ